MKFYYLLALVFLCHSVWGEKGPNVSLTPDKIVGSDQWSKPVEKILSLALSLTTQNLNYAYGSADPKAGGMDCSGTVYYVLTQAGFKDVPRSASEQYRWVREAGLFQAVNSTAHDSFELKRLQPGNLMFWIGTYDVKRDPPITHVMFYLGRLKKDGRSVMVGASDGRTYENIQRYGVSVFDFKLPGFPVPDRLKKSSSRFIGYSLIPGINSLYAPESTDSYELN